MKPKRELMTTKAYRLSKSNVYHQAGRIVAIYLVNQKRDLPEVSFRLSLESPELKNPSLPDNPSKNPYKYGYRIEGGKLLPELPRCFQDIIARLQENDRKKCQSAVEADTVNLLAGSLAEAKYVALRDGEVFNANLVYLNALSYYGGGKDLNTINQYMRYLYPDSNEDRKQKLAALFLEAYDFITDSLNWWIITGLAEAILNGAQETFSRQELIALVDSLTASNKPKFNRPFNKLQNNLL